MICLGYLFFHQIFLVYPQPILTELKCLEKILIKCLGILNEYLILYILKYILILEQILVEMSTI